MADTPRTLAALQALLADQATKAISPQDVRDFLVSIYSTARVGATMRVVDGGNFPLTVGGVQAALDEAGAANGGVVLVPNGAGIQVTTVSVKIPNRCTLMSFGSHTLTPTFVATAATNVAAMVENKSQDGTQQYCGIAGIHVDGEKALGAIVGAGILMKDGCYVGSFLRDCLITKCSGNGFKADGGATFNVGGFPVENLVVTLCNDHNVLIVGACSDGIHFYNLTSESVAAAKAQVMIDGNGAQVSAHHRFYSLHMEGTAASDGLVLDACSDVLVDGAHWDGGTSQLNVVKITGSVGGSDGSFAAGGHVLRNIFGNLATIIDDQVAGVVVGNAQGRFVREYISPAASATLDKSQVIGLQVQRKGVDVASATTIDLADGNYHVVTGVTIVDNISNAARYKGKEVTVQTSGALTMRHNGGGSGNIRASAGADLSMTANDMVKFMSDGTLWWQSAPVVVHA